MTGSALKTPKRVKMAKKWPNPISHEPIFVESWLTPHFVRKTHFSISVSYIVYLSNDRKYPKILEKGLKGQRMT